MYFMEEPIQFSVGQTAQSLTSSIMDISHTGSDDCLRILQACLRKRMSGLFDLLLQFLLHQLVIHHNSELEEVERSVVVDVNLGSVNRN